MFLLSPHGQSQSTPWHKRGTTSEAAEAFSASAPCVRLSEAAVAGLSSDLLRTAQITPSAAAANNGSQKVTSSGSTDVAFGQTIPWVSTNDRPAQGRTAEVTPLVKRAPALTEWALGGTNGSTSPTPASP
jgi:hypothetical protein